MEIETVEDLCNWIADKMGVYGTCKAAAKCENCEAKEITCCRVGFMMEMPDRIREAVKNDEIIKNSQNHEKS